MMSALSYGFNHLRLNGKSLSRAEALASSFPYSVHKMKIANWMSRRSNMINGVTGQIHVI
jgi:hypothetical protein